MTTTTDAPIMPEQKAIAIERKFNLSPDIVWKAWTEAESCKKWWGPKAYTCSSCTIDFRTGGKYLNAMKGTDGKEIWSTGTYKEIIPLKKIVQTDNFADSDGNIVPASFYNMPGEWVEELVVTVTFEEVDGKTNMTLHHAGLPAEMRDECIKGWQSSFDKLDSNFK